MNTASTVTRAPDAPLRDVRFAAACATLARLTADFHQRGWTPATSSNFSFRLDVDHCAVTASGGDKSTVREGDMLVTALDGRIVDAPAGRVPSAEAGLHQALYARDPRIGAVLHTHAPRALLAARLLNERPITLRDQELLKAFEDIDTHAHCLALPVVANDQDIDRLARAANTALDEAAMGDRSIWAYLIAGHGIYCWGSDLEHAARHLEAIDYLLGIELEALRLSPPRS